MIGCSLFVTMQTAVRSEIECFMHIYLFCFFKVVMNYVHDFFKVYREKPKFMFSFHTELSHDSHNLVGAVDLDMLEWLQTLNEEGHLNNTLLIIMSDHGPR